MKTSFLSALTFVTAITLSGCSTYGYAYDGYAAKVANYTAGDGVKTVETDLGKVVATQDGLSLYIFTKDSKNKSNCYNNCAVNWPPFLASADAKPWGQYSIINRKDGDKQWAFDGQPLYTWVGDQKEGDTNGQGVGGVWFVLAAQ